MILVDYVIISIVIFSALASLIREFVREALSLVTWACPCFVASHYYSYLAIYFICFQEQNVRNGIAIALLFVLSLIVSAIVNYVISSLVKQSGLSGKDLVLGIFFGVLRGILIVSDRLLFLDIFTGFSHSQEWKKSQLIPKFSGINRWFLGYLQSMPSVLPSQWLSQ